jgi:hypothetical protein
MVDNSLVPGTRWRQLPEEIICAILEHLPSDAKQRLLTTNSLLLGIALRDKYGYLKILQESMENIWAFKRLRRVQ